MQSSIPMAQQGHDVTHVFQTTCCIVGGGPAGAMLALLLARQGVSVMLLEAHHDFERDFRGDTVHPSVLHILDDIGLADRLLQLQHSKIKNLSFQTQRGETVTLVDFDLLTQDRYNFIAMIPQARFLDFITAEAKKYANFQLVMGAQVDALVETEGKVAGVRYRGQDGWYEVHAVLTVATDGRFSRMRKLAGLEPIKTSPPMDILWFRLSRQPDDPAMTFGRFANRQIIAIINRGDYWQIGYVIPKGQYQKIRAAGIEQLRASIASAVPDFRDRIHELQEWKQVAVLSVESNRLPQWYCPGLLLIGDAAHVMSPVGGVGINYAIQDAVVASNVLGPKLKYGIVRTRDLAEVQRQRQLPTRFIQWFQSVVQKNVLFAALNADGAFVLPPPMRIFSRFPGVRRTTALLIGYGLWPAHVKALS